MVFLIKFLAFSENEIIKNLLKIKFKAKHDAIDASSQKNSGFIQNFRIRNFLFIV